MGWVAVFASTALINTLSMEKKITFCANKLAWPGVACSGTEVFLEPASTT
jgi:hypothetical protein